MRRRKAAGRRTDGRGDPAAEKPAAAETPKTTEKPEPKLRPGSDQPKPGTAKGPIPRGPRKPRRRNPKSTAGEPEGQLTPKVIPG